jgi:phage shock protein A
MPDTPPDTAVPARLRRALVDALADIEQLTRRLDAALQSAADLERSVEDAARSGLITPDGYLFEHCRAMTSAAQAAAAAAFKVAEDMSNLR